MAGWVLKCLTESTWILERDGVRHSMVVATDQGLKVIGPLERKLFASMDELSAEVGGKLTVENRDEDGASGDEISHIDGYPIKHSNAHDINRDGLVTYSKAPNSKARFAAGYYAIDFDHGWTQSYCPRISTLETHGYIGPFRSKLEMQNAISAKKREIRI